MQRDTLPTKFFDMVSNTVNTLLVALGTVTFIWILAFLIVSMIE
jgi:hypothetical protein